MSGRVPARGLSPPGTRLLAGGVTGCWARGLDTSGHPPEGDPAFSLKPAAPALAGVVRATVLIPGSAGAIVNGMDAMACIGDSGGPRVQRGRYANAAAYVHWIRRTIDAIG